jgi:hypothetical protein
MVDNTLDPQKGPENVSDKEIDKIAYSKDYWPITLRWVLEGKTPALPDFVVWPENTKQVSDVVKIANDEEIPVVPFGEGSGVLGGAVPINGGIVIDIKRMNRILEINDKNLTVTAQPRTNVVDLERALNKESKIGPMEMNEEYIFHDPCVLSRKLGIYEEPREVLNSISKLKLKEAYFNKKDTRCCGLRGVLGITAPEISLKIAKNRSSELKEVCGSIVTACPACEMALKADKVLDISEVVLRGMKDGKGG